jgi:hypothetical protein
MSAAAVANPSARPLVVSGAVVGLTCAAALRGWMVQMAGAESAFHWYGTFALILAPGLCVGPAPSSESTPITTTKSRFNRAFIAGVLDPDCTQEPSGGLRDEFVDPPLPPGAYGPLARLTGYRCWLRLAAGVGGGEV